MKNKFWLSYPHFDSKIHSLIACWQNLASRTVFIFNWLVDVIVINHKKKMFQALPDISSSVTNFWKLLLTVWKPLPSWTQSHPNLDEFSMRNGTFFKDYVSKIPNLVNCITHFHVRPTNQIYWPSIIKFIFHTKRTTLLLVDSQSKVLMHGILQTNPAFFSQNGTIWRLLSRALVCELTGTN